MSGSQGLIGFEGCCCEPVVETCGVDIYEFEFLAYYSGATFYINPITFYARFYVDPTYINMGLYEPYEIPTNCVSEIDDNADCCGGVSGLEICCPTTGGCCAPVTSACPPAYNCFESECACPSCQNTGKTACGGTQGVYMSSTLQSNLNVDGDGTARMCCTCPTGEGPLYHADCATEFVAQPGCNGSPNFKTVCPNQAEDVAFLFSGNFSTAYYGFGEFQYKIPCDNSTVSVINSNVYGNILYEQYAASVRIRLGYLEFSLANVDYVDAVETTTCNTLMLTFTGTAKFCDATDPVAVDQYGSATWGKKYAPVSNLKTAGSFTVGRWYYIKVVGTTSFTSIGASSNTVGNTFQATGIGAGTGTAYQARTEAEAAVAKVGLYKLRSINAKNFVATEYDYGDHTWNGIERATAYAPILGVCTCHSGPMVYCYGTNTQGSCGDDISVDYPTCYNMNTDVMPNISNVVNPQSYIEVFFA